MRTSTLVTGMAVMLFAGTAAAEDQEFKVDQVIPLPADGIAAVNLPAGPVTFTEVRVRNMPDEDDIKKASSSDHSRPKPVVTAKSSATSKIEIALETTLVDDKGTSLMSCQRSVKLEAGSTDDWNVCFLEAMHTRDWPNVKAFHLVAKFKTKG